MKTNKEVIESLVDYFITQDPKIVATLLAAQMIDMNRFYNMAKLPKDEKKLLMKRLKHNIDQLHSFIRHGPNGDLTYGDIDDN
jgi:hypothetical protein